MSAFNKNESQFTGSYDIKLVVKASGEAIHTFALAIPELVRSCSTSEELSTLFARKILPLVLQTDTLPSNFDSSEAGQSRLEAVKLLEVFVICLTEKLPNMLLVPDKKTFGSLVAHTDADRLLRYRTSTVVSFNTLQADIEYAVRTASYEFQETLKRYHAGDLTEKLQAQINLFTAALIQHNLDLN